MAEDEQAAEAGATDIAPTASAREAALRDILDVISRSRDNEQPVLETIARHAGRLCDAPDVGVHLVNEARTHSRIACVWGPDKGVFPVGTEFDLSKTSAMGAAILEARTVQIRDFSKDPRYLAREPGPVKKVEEEGVLTFLCVPLIQDGVGIGVVNLNRYEVRPFTDAEIALLETFAAQAVIAIENVRQFRELQSRLERERATGQVLGAISVSREDEAPVFDTILDNALRLAGCKRASLYLLSADGAWFDEVAQRGLDPETADFLAKIRAPGTDRESSLVQAIERGTPVHILDAKDTERYRNPEGLRRSAVDMAGIRTMLQVPLMSGPRGIGVLSVYRPEVRAFSDDEIALLETFAAQAVIAIENVRQFREVQQRLEREKASREILLAISRSRDDDGPVFDVIMRNALNLSDSWDASLMMVSEDRATLTTVAAHGWGDEIRAYMAENPPDLTDPESTYTQTIETAEPIQIVDIKETDRYRAGTKGRRLAVDKLGLRTMLHVPLVSGGVSVGVISVYRREARAYAPDEIVLLQTFAAQAVIAIENVRQFRALQTRLERERATGEILGVISRSRDDETPVFRAILDKAMRLCGAAQSWLLMVSEAGDRFEPVANSGGAEAVAAMFRDRPIRTNDEGSDFVRAMRTRAPVHIPDARLSQRYIDGGGHRRRAVDEFGLRAMVLVPLLSGEDCLGVMALFRPEPRPFAPDQIALVETFAAQAVIAIENVRQFRALQSRLEREAATREILEVISRSRDDEKPVFDAILANASRLCHAPLAYLSMANEARTHATIPAYRGARPDFADALAAFREPIEGARLVAVRPIAEKRVIRQDDIADDDLYREREPNRVNMVEQEGARSILAVPLISGGEGVGAIVLYRREVAPFTDDDVALVEAFAAQAVIAIENVRQFREIQTRLERETASRRILQTISQSRENEQPVLEQIVLAGIRLVSSDIVVALIRDGDAIFARAGATRDGLRENTDSNRVPLDPSHNFPSQVLVAGEPLHLPDIDATRLPCFERDLYESLGIRSSLYMPLTRDRVCLGVLVYLRRERRAFSDDEVILARTFGEQAVIAIENVRQFRALEASNEEVRAQSDELQRLNEGLESRVAAQVGEIERMGRLKRFLSPAVADAVVHSGDEKLLSSHRALIAVLFCDIRGFTAFCETAEPEETIEVLQTYHEEMGRLLAEHGAGVDHRSGDGIMAIFNDPLPCDDPAGDALSMALAMRARMRGLCADWRKLGHRLGFGVGLSLGYATVGMVGSAGRYDYTASGTTVNLAARLCDEAGDGDILLSPRAFRAVEDRIATEPFGELTLKGISAPVEAFRVTGDGVEDRRA